MTHTIPAAAPSQDWHPGLGALTGSCDSPVPNDIGSPGNTEGTLGVQPAPSTARRIRILLADDSGVNRQMSLGLLRKLGYTADAVSNGLEVLAALRQAPYDLILMDCQMPEMGGYEATRLIRQEEESTGSLAHRGARVHIVAMTANALDSDRTECLSAGMDEYVQKPVRIESLKAALDHCRPTVAEFKPPSSPLPAPEVTVVDVERLREMAGDEPNGLPELIDLYMGQADQIMSELRSALRDESARDITRLAHKLGGSSSSCGMNGIAEVLRRLERLESDAPPDARERLFLEARRQIQLTRKALAALVPDSPSRKAA